MKVTLKDFQIDATAELQSKFVTTQGLAGAGLGAVL